MAGKISVSYVVPAKISVSRVAPAKRNPADLASAAVSGAVAGVAAAVTNSMVRRNPKTRVSPALPVGDWVRPTGGKAEFERLKITKDGKVYRGMWSYLPGLSSRLELERDPVAAMEAVNRLRSEKGWTKLLSNKAMFARERLESPKKFDPRSFRTLARGKARVVVGCPKGHWDPKTSRCKTSMKAQAILRPKEAVRARKNPFLQTILPPNPPKRIPFRDGQKIPVDKARAWVVSTGDKELLRQFDEAYRLQSKANRAPSYVVWRLLPIGSPRRIDAVAAMVEYGHTPETLYVPPKGSKKGSVVYRHKWGEGSGRSKPVPVLAAPGGKALVLPLRKDQKVSDWMRG